MRSGDGGNACVVSPDWAKSGQHICFAPLNSLSILCTQLAVNLHPPRLISFTDRFILSESCTLWTLVSLQMMYVELCTVAHGIREYS